MAVSEVNRASVPQSEISLTPGEAAQGSNVEASRSEGHQLSSGSGQESGTFRPQVLDGGLSVRSEAIKHSAGALQPAQAVVEEQAGGGLYGEVQKIVAEKKLEEERLKAA